MYYKYIINQHPKRNFKLWTLKVSLSSSSSQTVSLQIHDPRIPAWNAWSELLPNPNLEETDIKRLIDDFAGIELLVIVYQQEFPMTGYLTNSFEHNQVPKMMAISSQIEAHCSSLSEIDQAYLSVKSIVPQIINRPKLHSKRQLELLNSKKPLLNSTKSLVTSIGADFRWRKEGENTIRDLIARTDYEEEEQLMAGGRTDQVEAKGGCEQGW
ncbi:hypothetical protein L1887_32250 [Cichorium endivia]|nr:hypothetical protein L1887_32250 [Cichorium endivia]